VTQPRKPWFDRLTTLSEVEGESRRALDAPGSSPGQAYQVRHDGVSLFYCRVNNLESINLSDYSKLHPKKITLLFFVYAPLGFKFLVIHTEIKKGVFE